MAAAVLAGRADHEGRRAGEGQLGLKWGLGAGLGEDGLRLEAELTVADHPARGGEDAVERGVGVERRRDDLGQDQRLRRPALATDRGADLVPLAEDRAEGVRRATAAGDLGRMARLEREVAAAVVEDDARAWLEQPGAEGLEEALDQRDRAALVVDRGDRDGVAGPARRRLPGGHGKRIEHPLDVDLPAARVAEQSQAGGLGGAGAGQRRVCVAEERDQRRPLGRRRRGPPAQVAFGAGQRLGTLGGVGGEVRGGHRAPARLQEGDEGRGDLALIHLRRVVGEGLERRRQLGLAQRRAGGERAVGVGEDAAQARVGGDRVDAFDDRPLQSRHYLDAFGRRRGGAQERRPQAERRAEPGELPPAGDDPRHGHRERTLFGHPVAERAQRLDVDRGRRGAEREHRGDLAARAADERRQVAAERVLVRVGDDQERRRRERRVQRVAAFGDRFLGGRDGERVRRGDRDRGHQPAISRRKPPPGAASEPRSFTGRRAIS